MAEGVFTREPNVGDKQSCLVAQALSHESCKLSLQQGSPGISEITRGRFFFLSRPGHPPSPGPKTDMSEIFQEKHIWIWYLLQVHCVFVYALCCITTKHTC